MTSTTATRIYPFLDADVTQRYELHQLCGWGIVDPSGHDGGCDCVRLIHVESAGSVEELSLGFAIDYWILEPASTPEDVLATSLWLSGSGVIVGGLIWTEALAQC